MLFFHRYKVLRDCGFKVELKRHDKNNLTIAVKFPDELNYNPQWLYLHLAYDEQKGVFWGGSDLILASHDFSFNYHHYATQLVYRFSEILFREIKTNFRDFYFQTMMKHSFYKQS